MPGAQAVRHLMSLIGCCPTSGVDGKLEQRKGRRLRLKFLCLAPHAPPRRALSLAATT